MDSAPTEEEIRFWVSDLLEHGEYHVPLNNIPVSGYDRITAEVLTKSIMAGMLIGGQAAAVDAYANTGIRTTFDGLNPAAADWAANYSSTQVTGITDVTKQAIQDLVEKGFREGIHPNQLAKQIRPLIGLTTGQAQAVESYRQKLIDEDAVAPARIEKAVAKYRNKLHNERARTIARTETITSSAMGQQLLWEQMVADGELDETVIQRVWITAMDERKCPVCGALNGRTVGLRDNFSHTTDGSSGGAGKTYTALTPAIHPNCRCSIAMRVVSKRDGQGSKFYRREATKTARPGNRA